MFKSAIVRRPCPEMVDALTTAGLGRPDYAVAVRQHAVYVEILGKCGLRVTELEGDGRYPDSTFVEDVAVCTPHFAIITNPGAPSRNGEKEGMREVLRPFFDDIAEIAAPGTIDGGDVMLAGTHVYVGVSARTNAEGARQLIGILRNHGMTGSTVMLRDMLHLKTGVAYLEPETLLVGGEFVEHPEFRKFSRIVVDAREGYAANSLWLNGTVVVPSGHPATKRKIEAAGYPVIDVDLSEYRKLDGGLSCLSLRF
jgi:dimethylargininase